MADYPFAAVGTTRAATYVVAAANASAAWKNAASYVAAGSNDDLTINAAMAALPAQGGTVLLSDGTFTIGHAIIPTISNTRLVGQGLNATIIAAASGANCNGYQFDVSQGISLIFCALGGITFQGNGGQSGGGNTSGYGCHINYSLTFTFWDFYLRDVWFNNWAQDGFNSTGGHGYVLDHVLGEYCNGNGVTFSGGFVDSPPRIINGTYKLNGGLGVSVNTIDAYIGHNEISANLGAYGLVMSASGCKAVGNQVRSNTGGGVHVTNGSEGHELVANTISENGLHGILLDDANCTITGNFLTGNSQTTVNTSDEINIAHGTFSAAGNLIVGNVIDCASQSRYGINFSIASDTAGVAEANRIIGAATAATNTAATDTTFIATTGAGVTTVGPVDVLTAGQGLKVAEGSNAKQGTAALTAGSVVVANTSVTASSRIFLTSNADGGTPGFVRVSARTAGTSFTITSSSGTDTSTIAYEIFEPG